MASRMKEIEKIYAKARREGKMAPKKRRPLDNRMKKELRAQKRVMKKSGGKNKGGKVSKAQRRLQKDPRASSKKR